MAKRARVKGKGADIFFSEPEVKTKSDAAESIPPDPAPAPPPNEENARLKTEISVLQARIKLLEKELEPLRTENEAMRKRLETYADAFAKLLFKEFTAGSDSANLLNDLLSKVKP